MRYDFILYTDYDGKIRAGHIARPERKKRK